MESASTEPGLREAAAFYAPLALNSLMMMFSQTLIAAGLARTASPLIALAAYSLARSVLNMIENPLYSVRQITVVFGATTGGASRTFRFVMALAGAIAALLLTLGFGPWAQTLIARTYGVTEQVSREVVHALRVYATLPFIIGWRSFNQGQLIRARRTVTLPIGTLLRLGVIAVWALNTPRFPGWGAASAAAALSIAMAVESVFIGAGCRHRTPLLLQEDPVGPDTGYRAIALFALPLAAVTFLHCLSTPLIHLGLGRFEGAIAAVAAFSVGDSLARLALSPVQGLHQLVLVFHREGAKRLGRYVIGFGALVTALLIVLSVVFIDTIVIRLMGLTGETARSAAWVFRVLALQPMVVSIREYHWGVMYRRRSTSAISFAKAINLVTVVIVLTLGLRAWGGLGAVIGALALLMGETTEAAVIARLSAIDTKARQSMGTHRPANQPACRP